MARQDRGRGTDAGRGQQISAIRPGALTQTVDPGRQLAEQSVPRSLRETALDLGIDARRLGEVEILVLRQVTGGGGPEEGGPRTGSLGDGGPVRRGVDTGEQILVLPTAVRDRCRGGGRAPVHYRRRPVRREVEAGPVHGDPVDGLDVGVGDLTGRRIVDDDVDVEDRRQHVRHVVADDAVPELGAGQGFPDQGLVRRALDDPPDEVLLARRQPEIGQCGHQFRLEVVVHQPPGDGVAVEGGEQPEPGQTLPGHRGCAAQQGVGDHGELRQTRCLGDPQMPVRIEPLGGERSQLGHRGPGRRRPAGCHGPQGDALRGGAVHHRVEEAVPAAGGLQTGTAPHPGAVGRSRGGGRHGRKLNPCQLLLDQSQVLGGDTEVAVRLRERVIPQALVISGDDPVGGVASGDE
nr:hypothetical protein Ade03nite_66490 [Actinoplanes derwentensis]